MRGDVGLEVKKRIFENKLQSKLSLIQLGNTNIFHLFYFMSGKRVQFFGFLLQDVSYFL